MKHRQKAFEGNGKFLKGNLHSHTTRSDGEGKPEEVVAQYIEMGYDFLAITDHNLYNFSSFGQEGITIIPGMEVDKNLQKPYGIKCFHSLVLGAKENNGFKQDEKYQGGGFFENLDEYQKVLDEAHEKNNITIYCHPNWSRTFARDFEDLTGNVAMEVWNSGCALENDCDTDAPCWDELLLQGKKIFGVATDDGHHSKQNGFGWIMVKSENTISGILSAIKAGAFYATTGPTIKDFYVEDGYAYIKTSKAKYAGFAFGSVPNRLEQGEGDHLVEEAKFPIPKKALYVRGVVKDEKGRRAWSNPIFLDEVK